MSEPEQLLADIESYIDRASDMLAKGEAVRLAGLDDAVDKLCKRVLELPNADGQAFVERFEKVHNRLEALQVALEKAKQATADEISGALARQKATRAYAKAPEEKK